MVSAFKPLVRPLYHALQERRYQPLRAKTYLGNAWFSRQHQQVTASDFLASRKTDTLFIFGSGYSLNEISPAAWAHMAAYDTLGFNMFVFQRFIRTDYHIVREITDEAFNRAVWYPVYENYIHHLNTNPFYQDTLLLLQQGWKAYGANRLIALNLLDRPRRLLRFVNRPDPLGEVSPTRKVEDGILHRFGTLTDALHFGYIGGWKQLVLVGVDLYDRRYFYLPPDQFRVLEAHQNKSTQANKTITADTMHQTALNGIVPYIGQWARFLSQQDIKVYCLNPRSLLKEVLPVYEIPPFSPPQS